jgi:plasmid stability protein
MATMTIRNIDDQRKARLRLRAARHNRSMEAEARDILRAALSVETARSTPLASVIRARIDPLGGIELEIPERGPMRDLDVTPTQLYPYLRLQ